MGRIVAIALVVVAAGIAVVVAGGPGSDRPEGPAGGPVSARVTAAGPQSQAAPARRPARVGATVRMRRLRFVGPDVTVAAGRAVRFVNADDVAHAVSEDVGARSGVAPAFRSRRIPPDGSFTYVTRSARTIRYVCTLHPTVMFGRIVVTRR